MNTTSEVQSIKITEKKKIRVRNTDAIPSLDLIC
jgi:hypothetical protein